MNYPNFYPHTYPYYDASGYYPAANPWPYAAQPTPTVYQPTQYFTEQYVNKHNVFHPPQESRKPERVLHQIPITEAVPLPSDPFPGSSTSSTVQPSTRASSDATAKKPYAIGKGSTRSQSLEAEGAPTKGKSTKTQPPAYRFLPYGKNEEWKLAPNRDILVVDPKTSSAAPVNVINLRKPCASVSMDYTAVSPPSQTQAPQKYESTVSNRLKLSGPDSLSRSHNSAAHSQGIGKYLLQKMGWSEGKPLGHPSNASSSDPEPLAAKLGLKLNKKGLGVPDGYDGIPEKTCAFLNDKCRELGWKLPQYVLVSEDGPPHQKSFLFKIILNGVEHSANVPGSSKKIAKANVAKVCINALFNSNTAEGRDGSLRPSFGC
ncbi:uncharacterized protein LOC129602711 [Paramacrobiotus metropolitanus]|uniref:uncharacterized protein LOC129602711 n=1 Tax=Paramacrobiotus metropolitanus TaxID=2943436 RepID=UPI00244570FC|nr:uncharacterized protein LOC129602711 [Paramacrobiotus metropolitanus]